MAEEAQKKKILLVEDDVFMIELFAKAAREAGFEIINITHGKEVIEKIQEINPDLTVLDLMLPDMGGFEILREIRREPDGSMRKVFIMSNVSEASDVEEARRLGALDYLVKANTTLEEVMGKIKAALAA